MLEEYLKRLEDMIVPQNYNKSNFREKIKAELEDPAELEEIRKKREIARISAQNCEVVSEEKKLLDEYIHKMGGADESQKSLAGGKVKIYQKILDNEAEAFSGGNNEINENPLRAMSSKSGKTYSLSPSRTIKSNDDSNLREKIHTLNLKAMNYRHEIETLKNTITELKAKIEEQNLQIVKLDRQKEADNKYLIKLESLLATKESNGFNSINKSKIMSDKTLLSNFHSKSENLVIDFNRSNNLIIEDKANNTLVNFNDRNEVREFISNLVSENQKLKAFQNEVFQLSKKYDDVNENMIDGMKQIGLFLNLPKNDINIDEAPKKDIITHFEKLVENVEKTLEVKQSEYNFLLETKDQEIKFISEEVVKLNETVESIKRDRIRDQKIMNDYECEINFLSSRIEENNCKVSESVVKDDTNLKLQKKMTPAKTAVTKIVKKLERTFDLQDKNNVKLISNINKSIK